MCIKQLKNDQYSFLIRDDGNGLLKKIKNDRAFYPDNNVWKSGCVFKDDK